MQGFIFDATKGETPASLARKRAIAEALLQESQSGVAKNVPEGLAQLGKALSGRFAMNALAKKEKESQERSAGSVAAIMAAYGGGGAPSSASATTDASGNLDGYLSSIRAAESGGNDAAKNPLSSATGRYQFTSGTWADVGRAHPDLGLTPEGRLDPEQQEKAIRAFTQDNAGTLTKAGIPITGGSLYGAHFLGSGGATKVFGSDPSASVAEIVGPEVVRANPFLRGMTVGDFQQWAAKKGGGGAIAFDGTPAAPMQPDPIQVASLDPSAGVAQATAQRPMPPEYADRGLSPDAWARMNAPDAAPAPQQTPAAAPPQADPWGGMRQAATQPQQQIAQALNSGAAPQGGQPRGPTIEMLMQASQDPWLSEGHRGIVNMLLQKEMQKNDPAYQMGIEKDRLELDALRNPRISPADQARLDMDRAKLGFEQKDSATDNQREAAKLKLEQDKYANDSTLAREKFDWEKDKDRLPEFYDAYVKQERDAGREPLGILDYVTTSKKAGASNVSVGGTTIEGEKKYDQTVGEGYGKRFNEMQDAATAAQQTLSSLDVMEQAMSDPNFYSGSGDEFVAGLKRLGASVGINPDSVSSMESFSALAKKAALDSMGGSLGSGFSNADRDFVTGQVPSLSNTPEGNRKLIEIQRKLNTRKQEIAGLARQYAAEHNNRIDAGFDDYVSKWAKDNPLFPKAAKPDASQKSISDMTDAELEAIINGQ